MHLDRLVYRIITDGSIRAANLKSGDAQVADTLGTDDVDSVKQDSKLSVLESPSLGYQGVTFNVGNVKGVGKPLGKINEPLRHRTRGSARRSSTPSTARPSSTTSSTATSTRRADPSRRQTEFTSDAAQTCREYDPAKAKALLKEAGVKTPYRITMLATRTRRPRCSFVQALQAMVKEGGFDLKIDPIEFTSLLELQDQGKFEMLQLGWSGRVDPDGNINNFVGTGAVAERRGLLATPRSTR